MRRIYQILIYELFRVYFYLVLRIFYRVRHFKQDPRIKNNCPTIVVSNHPNTMIDPILCGLRYKGQLNFLANTGLFKHPMTRWFFLLHFCIPIKRSQDPDIPGFPLEHSFDLSLKALENNRTIFIAPEGTSLRGYHVRKIKYGTEKIIRDFIERTQRPIQLIINGISYQAPGDFRSALIANSIAVLNIDSLGEEGDITNQIESSLREEIIDWPDMEMEEVEKLRSSLFPKIPAVEEWYLQLKKLADWRKEGDNSNLLNQYLAYIQNERIDTGSTAKEELVLKWKGYLVLCFPIYALFYVTSFIPRMLSRGVLRVINTHKEYDSTIKVSVYPLIFLLYSWLLAGFLIGNSWFILPILLLLAGGEVIRKNYNNRWRRFQNWRAFRHLPEQTRLSFLELHDKILSSLNHD